MHLAVRTHQFRIIQLKIIGYQHSTHSFIVKCYINNVKQGKAYFTQHFPLRRQSQQKNQEVQKGSKINQAWGSFSELIQNSMTALGTSKHLGSQVLTEHDNPGREPRIPLQAAG